MKSLTNKVIIYDQNCPMCAMYTQGFVEWGLLKQNNRVPFAKLSREPIYSKLDLQRARHEIPLIDLTGTDTIYGLDALLFILSGKIPLLVKVAQVKPFYVFFKTLYNLVSYNRRIIVPGPLLTSKPANDCTPDFHYGYRIAFIAVAALMAIVLTYWFGYVSGLLLPSLNGTKIILIAGTGWILQMLLALSLPVRKRIDYLGHLSAVMLVGVFILVPGILLSYLTSHQYITLLFISVAISSLTMLRQHIRRAQSLHMSQWWTAAWFVHLQSTALLWLYFFYFNQ